MKKGLIWFLAFLFVAIVTFVIVVLVLSSQHGLTFIQEIQSWFPEVVDTTKDVIDTTASIRLIA